MIKSRLEKIEKKIAQKATHQPVIPVFTSPDGSFEYNGKRFVNKESLEAEVKTNNIIYFDFQR